MNLLILVIQWAAVYVVIGTLLAAVKDSIDRRALPPAARMGEFEIKLFVLTWPAVLALGLAGAIGRWCAWVVIGLRGQGSQASGDDADRGSGGGPCARDRCEVCGSFAVHGNDGAPIEVVTATERHRVDDYA